MGTRIVRDQPFAETRGVVLVGPDMLAQVRSSEIEM